MKSLLMVFTVLVLGLGAAQALADGAAPWLDDEALLKQTQADVEAAGTPKAVAPHLAALEAALASAKHSMDLAAAGGQVLTDGSADSLLAMMTAAAGHKNATAIHNPYPTIALYLGSYYVEAGKADDAVRVLDAGLAASALSQMRPLLFSERGTALNALHRFNDSLTNYADALAIPDLDPSLRARLERGRGFALTELKRLDEAEAAYNASLKDEPGNTAALGELKYIAGLRAGGASVEGVFKTKKEQAEQQPSGAAASGQEPAKP
jgi:tetratricopeptide (TPR) repeat protein